MCKMIKSAIKEDFFSPFHLLDLKPICTLDHKLLEQNFLKKQIKMHPDAYHNNDTPEATKKFAILVEAYHTLKNLQKRAELFFKAAQKWPIPQSRDVLEKLMHYQEDRPPCTTLQKNREEAGRTLCHALDKKDFDTAARAFVLYNGFRQLLKRKD